jgi:cell division protein FtsB
MTASDTILILAVVATLFGIRRTMAIDALTAAVHAAAATITSLSAKVGALKTQVADLTAQIATLRGDDAADQVLADELNAANAAAPQD